MIKKNKIKLFCILMALMFNYKVLAYDAIYEKKAEKIIEFIVSNASTAKSAITGKSKDIGKILKLLENKIIFDTITKLLIEENISSKNESLTQGEKGILLSLCLYRYSKDTNLYWSQVSDQFGVFPDINLFLDVDESSNESSTNYVIYQISPNQILFLQLLGRGAHNNSYFLWKITIDDNKFKAILLDVPRYIEESKSFQIQPDFLAKFFSYDPEKRHVTINISNDYEERNTYKIENDKLSLIESCGMCRKF